MVFKNLFIFLLGDSLRVNLATFIKDVLDFERGEDLFNLSDTRLKWKKLYNKRIKDQKSVKLFNGFKMHEGVQKPKSP